MKISDRLDMEKIVVDTLRFLRLTGWSSDYAEISVVIS